MDSERKMKQELIKSADSVKKKVKQLQNIKNNNNLVLDDMLKSITEPLNKIANNSTKKVSLIDNLYPKKETDFKPYNENDDDDDDLPSFNSSDIKKSDYSESDDKTETDSENDDLDQSSNNSFKTLDSNYSPNRSSLSWSMKSEMLKDVPFGVRMERGKYMMGSARVTIKGNTITIAGRTYDVTPGLNQLLFRRTPDLNLITQADTQVYKKLLLETNVHRRNFDPHKAIKSNKGKKYLHIIKPLFKKNTNAASIESLPQGSGLPLMKKMKMKTDYVYWDDPNELVERLKLLVASRDAGNTGLEAEIISIIEELREKKLVN